MAPQQEQEQVRYLGPGSVCLPKHSNDHNTDPSFQSGQPPHYSNTHNSSSISSFTSFAQPSSSAATSHRVTISPYTNPNLCLHINLPLRPAARTSSYHYSQYQQRRRVALPTLPGYVPPPIFAQRPATKHNATLTASCIRCKSQCLGVSLSGRIYCSVCGNSWSKEQEVVEKVNASYAKTHQLEHEEDKDMSEVEIVGEEKEKQEVYDIHFEPMSKEEMERMFKQEEQDKILALRRSSVEKMEAEEEKNDTSFEEADIDGVAFRRRRC